MRADRTLAAAALAVLLSSSVWAAADREAADAAFDAGDAKKALALYDEILAESPGDVDALLKSGKLLSWDRRYDEALARYDRALAREPSNTAVLLERGKVLLWSKRYDDAIPAFDRVLKLDPREPWALCGTAQAYAWSGRRRQARPYYERALEAQPDMKEALIGIAYLDLEEGDPTKAATRVEALRKITPSDPEVAELDTQVRRARAPWVAGGWDGASDSDDNAMYTARVEGGFGLPARLNMRLAYAHSWLSGPTLTDPDASGSADVLAGVLGWQARPDHRVELRLGSARLEDSVGDTRTTAVGGITYAFPIAKWNGVVAANRDPFLYSPRILDNAIDVTALTFNASGHAGRYVRVETNAGYGHFSDGNDRISADAGAWYVKAWPKQSLQAGFVLRTLDYTEDLDNGYFDPDHLLAALGSVRSSGSLGSSAWQYDATLEAGVQSFTLHGDDASNEPLFNLYGLVSRPFAHGLTLQIFAGFGNSSTASGPGYSSRSGGFRLRYTIGG